MATIHELPEAKRIRQLSELATIAVTAIELAQTSTTTAGIHGGFNAASVIDALKHLEAARKLLTGEESE